MAKLATLRSRQYASDLAHKIARRDGKDVNDVLLSLGLMRDTGFGRQYATLTPALVKSAIRLAKEDLASE